MSVAGVVGATWMRTEVVHTLYGPRVLVEFWDLSEGNPDLSDPHLVYAFTAGVLDGVSGDRCEEATGRFLIQSLISFGVLIEALDSWRPQPLTVVMSIAKATAPLRVKKTLEAKFVHEGKQ